MTNPPAEVHHHHYYPNSIRGWYFQKGNHIMVQFQTNVSDSEIEAAFTSPSTGGTIDSELVKHLQTLGKGQAIKLPKDNTISPRSLKVRVNKAAKEANRKLGWAEVTDGHIARVVEILTPTPNGTLVSTEVTVNNNGVEPSIQAPTEATTEAASGRTRNR